MDTPFAFTRNFAQLVWLFLREPGSTYEQQTVLESLAESVKDAEVNLTLADGVLRQNGAPVPSDVNGVADLTRQIALHGLALISVDAGASPAELFGTAGIIATMPVMDDGGVAAEEKRREIGIKTIRFAARPRATTQMPQVAQTPLEMELGEVFADPVGQARANFTPRSTQMINHMVTPAQGVGTGVFAEFAAPLMPRESVDDLLAQLDRVDDVEDATEITRLVGALALQAEDAGQAGKAVIVSKIMTRIAAREQSIVYAESKRACSLTLRRPELLRVIAAKLPNHLDRRDEFIAVLTRAGENGSEALVEQLMLEPHQKDRRVYFDALMQLNAGVPSLLHMLHDSRWFAMRNAAELLGEMHVSRAEHPLTDLQTHPDERVARAAKNALLRMNTPRAMVTIEQVFKTGDAQYRTEAAAALVARKDGRSTATLLQALDAERDPGVQVALLGALGKVATPEAVQHLRKCAQAGGSLFKKRTLEFRVAATHALADAGTLEALEALRSLQSDKEADVRAAATLSLGRVTRRATTSLKSIQP